MPLAIRTPTALVDLDVPSPTASQYLRRNAGGTAYEWATAGGTAAHSGLTGLTSGDDHTQYAFLAGRSGGQTLTGDTASGGGLTLVSTAHATKGAITAGPLVLAVASSPNALITSQAAAHIVLRVKGASSQTGYLTEWQNSAGTGVARIDAAGDLTLSHPSANILFSSTGSAIRLSGGGTLSIIDGAGVTLATFVHQGGGTLTNAGTVRIQWNATGLGFFAATPVAKQAFIADPTGGATVDAEARTAITAVITALENYGLLATS